MATSTPSKRNAAVIADTVTTTGNVVIGGDLTVSGTTTTINTETINLADNIIVLNSNASGAATENAGIEIERGTDTNVSLIWDEGNNRWTVGSSNFVAGTFIGALSGNASTASSAAKWTTARTLSLTGDVTGSVSWDGSANASISTTVVNDSHTHGYTTLDHLAAGNLGTTTSPNRWWMSSFSTGQSDVPGNYFDIINLSSASTHGIQIASGYAANSGLIYIRTRSDNNSAPAGPGLQAWNKLWHNNNDGSGSGLDADLLDGQHGSYYATASSLGGYVAKTGDTMTGTLTNTVDVRAPIFYDSNDTGYYVDPASTTQSARFRQFVQIGDSASYNGNTGSWGARLNVTDNIHAKIEVGQDADGMLSYWYAHTGHSSIKFGTSSAHDVEIQRAGTTELGAYSGYALAHNQMRSPIFYDSADTSYYWNPNDTAAHRFNTASGYVHIGPMNTSHCHISTDRSNFYFNTEIRVNTGVIGSYDEDLYLRRASNASHQIQIAAGTTTISQNTVVQGTLTANSVNVSDGFGTLYTFSESITLTTSWQDTSISSTDLPTGSYVVQVALNDYSVGGGQYSEYYTGYMSWTAGGTNDTSWDEIPLHSAGHADNDQAIYLRTLRRASSSLILQIAGETNNTAASTYTFKFRRMI